MQRKYKGKKVPKPRKSKSIIKGVADNKNAELSTQDNKDFMLSFKHLDNSQGQTLCEWEEDGILAQAMDVLRNYCCASLISQCNNEKFTVYGDFPPKNLTEFCHPRHVPDDACWARIHINGSQCVIGHVDRNVFNVVFLDKDHRFWRSNKK